MKRLISSLCLLLIIACDDGDEASPSPDSGSTPDATPDARVDAGGAPDTGLDAAPLPDGEPAGDAASDAALEDALAPDFTPRPEVARALPGEIVSLHLGAPGYALTRHALIGPDDEAVPLPAERPGRRLSAAWVEGDSIWLGFEYGEVFHSPDRGQTWARRVEGYVVPEIPILTLTLRRPIPRRFFRDSRGRLLLATVGRGVMIWDEGVEAWVDGTFAFTAALNPLTWTLVEHAEEIFVGFLSPIGIATPDQAALLGPLVQSWIEPLTVRQRPLPDEGARVTMSLASNGARMVAGMLGRGVFEWIEGRWRALGDLHIPDLVAVALSARGDVAALGLGGGVHLWDGAAWTLVRCPDPEARPGIDLRFVDHLRLEAALDDQIVEFDAIPTECPAAGGARVYLALSQHTNLYHSYRGNTPDEDGYGKDLRIIRSTLEILGRYPAFHNDWDIENMFSLDNWLPAHAPDIVEGIRARVESGQDGLRLMSFNNGLMAHETVDEFDASITRAQASYEAFAPGAWHPGVQPQENMYTPAHAALYRARGVEWMTLFYSGTSFNGFRDEIDLSLREAHSPITLRSPLHEATMTLLPVYHPGDMLEHGGLANWLRQLHAHLEGDVMLILHMDADSETWLGVETELRAVEALEADWIIPARIQDIVDALPPVADVTITRDLADGAFDGFSSWTEKPQNHRFYTRIARARRLSAWARALSDAPEVLADLDASFEARLRSLSTTHFGLSNPDLHPQREADGEAATLESEARARAALARALGERAQPTLINPEGGRSFLLAHDAPLEGAQARSLTSEGRAWIIGSISAGEEIPLTPAEPALIEAPDPRPSGWAPPDLEGLISAPRFALDGVAHEAELREARRRTGEGVDEVWTLTGGWPEGGAARVDWLRVDASGAWWVEVDVTWPEIEGDWDDVIPLPIHPAPVEALEITRPLTTGEIASYTVTEHADALNNHAADGWVFLSEPRSEIGLAIMAPTTFRAAPAFAPLRLTLTEGGLTPLVAPFGALFGELVDHAPARLLGVGFGEWMTRLAAPQLSATAGAWPGERVHFMLWIHPRAMRAEFDGISTLRDGVLLLTPEGPRGSRRD